MNQLNPCKWRHFETEIILSCVRWYLRYSLSSRDLEEMMRERGLEVDHTTRYRWVQRYAPELEKRCRPHLKAFTDSWKVDETSIKVRKTWMYHYRAVDSQGNTLEFLLSARRDAQAAKRFFVKALHATACSAPQACPVEEQGPSRLDRLTPPHQLLTSFMSRRMRPLPKLWSNSKPPRRYQPALRRARAQSFLVHGEVTDHESRDTMDSLVSRFCPHTGAAACFACLARARHPGPQLRSCRPWRRDHHTGVGTGLEAHLLECSAASSNPLPPADLLPDRNRDHSGGESRGSSVSGCPGNLRALGCDPGSAGSDAGHDFPWRALLAPG